jgi:hypothetical protein
LSPTLLNTPPPKHTQTDYICFFAEKGGGEDSTGNNAAEHILEYISREDNECIVLFFLYA